MKFISALLGCAFAVAAASSTHASLLTPSNEAQLETWLASTGLYSGNLTFTNVYTKQTGNTAASFHAGADNKGPTVVLMSVTPTGGGATHLIGGFNPQSWDSLNHAHTVADPSQRTAFIFDLTTLDFRPQIAGLYGEYQTWNLGSWGPTFGMNPDLYVDNALGTVSLHPYSYGNDCLNLSSCSGKPNFYNIAGQTFLNLGALEVYTLSAIAPVPEPSTWALMVSGFAVVGFLAYRRRSTLNPAV